jgi:hypothetical protein
MTRPFPATDRLQQLLDGLCEDQLTAAEMRELEQLVRQNPDARWFYLSYLDLHGSLIWDVAGGARQLSADWTVPDAAEAAMPDDATIPHAAARSTDAQSAGAARPQRRRAGLWAGSTVAICLVGLGLWWQHGPPEPAPNSVVATPSTSPEAIITPDAVDQGSSDRVAAPRVRQPVQLAGSSDLSRGAPSIPERSAAAPATSSTDVAVEATLDAPADALVALSPPAVVLVAERTDLDPSLRGVVQQVDQLLADSWLRWQVTPSPRAEDHEWLRRITLDVAGRIPTLQEVETFLADQRPDKRQRRLDDLLESTDFARNLATTWANLLVGRSPANPLVNRDQLLKFLRMSFAENRPWNAVVADLVAAEGTTDHNGATNFLVAHLNNQAVPATAVTARVFLGLQLQCVQCHKHPFNDLPQTAFWEMNSLFQQTEIVQHRRLDPSTGRPALVSVELTDKPLEGPIHFETRQGLMQAAFPRFAGTEIDASAATVRRKELARLLTSGDQPQLARAFVNRVWAQYLGAGFTQPVDDLGAHNPPSHPELLAALSDDFIASGYDIRRLIRVICSSDVYQRSSRPSVNNQQDDPVRGEAVAFSRVYLKPMTAEQLLDSLLVASRANLVGASDWIAAEQQRQRWLEQFVVSLQNDENDEVETLAGKYDQALLLMNSDLMQRAIETRPGSLLGDLLQQRGSEADKIRQLFLVTLSRPPSTKEMSAMQRAVRAQEGTARSGRGTMVASAYQDLFWALLNSNEFAAVH